MVVGVVERMTVSLLASLTADPGNSATALGGLIARTVGGGANGAPGGPAVMVVVFPNTRDDGAVEDVIIGGTY